MELLIDEDCQRVIESLYSDRTSRLRAFSPGEAPLISCCPVKQVRNPTDGRVFAPIDPTDWIIQVAIGGGFTLPVAGWWPIAYGADESDPILSKDPTADEISSALNDLASVVSAGGVTVAGGSGFFVITFNDVGARTMISGDPSLLIPLSLLNFERVVTGDGDTQEVQVLRIVQNAGTFATLSTNSSAAAVAFSLIQAGDATHNAKWRVTLPEHRYSGYWTFTKPAGSTSGKIGYDDNDAEILAVFEALYGAGNVLIERETEDTFTVELIGSLTHTAVTIPTVTDASTLRAIPFKSGVIDLRVAGIEMLLNGSSEKVVKLEVEATDDDGNISKILQQDVFLRKPVLEADMTSPQFLGSTQSAIASITNGADSVTVTFPQAFAVAPTNVVATVLKPTGGDNIFATVVRNSISRTEFTAELSGAVPDGNYKLSWIAEL